jgi:hypothetical protein
MPSKRDSDTAPVALLPHETRAAGARAPIDRLPPELIDRYHSPAQYLLVLLVSSCVSLERGLVEPLGELPVWASLALLTFVAAAALLRDADTSELPTARKTR